MKLAILTMSATFLLISGAAQADSLFLSQQDAVVACKAKGGHLPTAREFAQLLTNLGAQGIAEMANGKPDASYVPVRVKNLDGSKDEFYFSSKGYVANEELKSNFYVTSSTTLNYAIPKMVDGSTGRIQTHPANQDAGGDVLCVQ